MYILSKCSKQGDIVIPQGQTICVSHLHLLALGITYVSERFKAKKLMSSSKYAQLLGFEGLDAIVIGEVYNTCIINRNGKRFDFNVSGNCFLENFIVNKKTKEKKLYNKFETIHNSYNAVGLLSCAIHFNNRLLKSEYTWRKMSYYYMNGDLLYIIDRNGIFDTDMKLLFDFYPFFVSNSIPKRLTSIF